MVDDLGGGGDDSRENKHEKAAEKSRGKLEDKNERMRRRVKRRQRFLEALRYHHKPNAEKLKETMVKGGSKTPDKEGLNEDLESKVGDKLYDMRARLNKSRAKAEARGDDIFRGL